MDKKECLCVCFIFAENKYLLHILLFDRWSVRMVVRQRNLNLFVVSVIVSFHPRLPILIVYCIRFPDLVREYQRNSNKLANILACYSQYPKIKWNVERILWPIKRCNFLLVHSMSEAETCFESESNLCIRSVSKTNKKQIFRTTFLFSSPFFL